jgi:hypothetical protein
MKPYTIRKLLVVLIIITPVLTDLGCRKQAKCGCGKDVIRTLIDFQSVVYFDAVTKSATFIPLINDGSRYIFCNPGEMMSTLSKFKSGDYFLVSGKVYWECTYLMNSSNYSYGYLPPTYQVQVTSVTEDLYGKK